MNTPALLTIMGVVLVLVLLVVGMPRRGKQWRLRGSDERDAARLGREPEHERLAFTVLLVAVRPGKDALAIRVQQRARREITAHREHFGRARTTRVGKLYA